MKKVLSIISACLIFACVMLMAIAPVCAATPKENIVAEAKKLIPAAYQAEYLPILENTLQQIEVTAEQATAVINHMNAAAKAVEEDKGDSLSHYSANEQTAVLTEIKAACTALNLTYELTPAENPTHEGDMDFYVYAPSGEKIADIDFDIKKTNSAVDYTMVVAVLTLVVVAAGVAVCSKKLLAAR